jgi:transcriptional regulator
MSILRGTLDILVLKTLSWGPMHAFEITSWLESRSDGHLDVDDSALIQALHRMEARGLVSAEWGTTQNDRRARYYRITPAGRAHLRTEGADLAGHVAAIGAILAARSAGR